MADVREVQNRIADLTHRAAKPQKQKKASNALTIAQRRQKVSDLYIKGLNSLEIAEVLGDASGRTIRYDIQLINKTLMPRTEKAMQYRKNLMLAKLRLIVKTSWQVIEDNKQSPSIGNACKRVIISALELAAKVDGLITEKLQVGPERASEGLLKELRDIEKQAKGNGHKVDADVGTETANLPEDRV